MLHGSGGLSREFSRKGHGYNKELRGSEFNQWRPLRFNILLLIFGDIVGSSKFLDELHSIGIFYDNFFITITLIIVVSTNLAIDLKFNLKFMHINHSL